MTAQNKSPLPRKKIKSETVDFFAALKAVHEGDMITKLEWGSSEIYGLLRYGQLQFKKDGKFHQWIISDGDLAGEDWVIIKSTQRMN